MHNEDFDPIAGLYESAGKLECEEKPMEGTA